jgi:serine/threonine-protein kinase RsbW
VSTTGPTRLPTDTFAYRVLTVLADDVRVLAETPTAPGDAHRLALRLTMRRPDTSRPGEDPSRQAPRDVPAVASMHDRPGTSGP